MPDQVLKDVLRGGGKRVVAAGRAAQVEGAVHASVEVRQSMGAGYRGRGWEDRGLILLVHS